MTATEKSVLGIDHGERRIGLAFKPPGETMVLPLKIVEVNDLADVIGRIREIIREKKIEVVVTGLPLNPDPEQVRKVKKFTRRLRKDITGVRWRFIDETLTSSEADSRLREDGLERPTGGIDSVAACIILESWLEAEGES